MMTWEEFKGIHLHPYRLTVSDRTTMLPYMGRREVIEYTEDFVDEDSTSIEHVWYNVNTERLTIKFRHGGTYSYDGVSEELFDEFKDAESLGSFFHATFSPKGEEKWPGVKHDERLIDFLEVDSETPEVEPDLDALKPAALTGGKGKRFKLHFSYSAKGEMEVRAEGVHEAVAIFQEYMAEHGFKADVTEVTMNLTDL